MSERSVHPSNTTVCRISNNCVFPRDPSKTTSHESDQIRLEPASTAPSADPTTQLLRSTRLHEAQPLYVFTQEPISEQDFEKCRQALRSCFEKCGAAFFIICFAISLVLNSVRPLHKQELEAALAMLSQKSTSTGAVKQDGIACGIVPMANDWLRASGAFMTEDACGNVEFLMPAMKVFLRQVQIRGVDPSYRLIALACVKQVNADASQHNPTTAFSRYAAEHRAEHVKSAEASSYMDQSNC